MIKIGKTKITLERDMTDIVNVPSSDLPKYIGEPIKIEEGVTFKRIFNLIIMNRKIFNTIFYSFTRGFDIDLYIEDYLKESEDVDSAIDYCEVYRVYENFKYDDGTEEDQYYYAFHGKGKPTKEGALNYGFSFTSLSELKNLPIKTNENLEITIDTGLSFDDKDFDLKNKYKKIHTAKIPITLFNFIGAILYEITFTGTPANRDEKLNDLQDTVERIKNGEEETFEFKKDDDGEFYFLDKDGNKDYLNKDDEEDN